MGTQKMESQAGGSGGGGGSERSQIQSLTRQGSLYNLTLNEVQNHLGEPLLSMNLDELLKSVLPADANQPLSMDLEGTSNQYGSSSAIQRQGSITMPRGLRRKTVDEVWKDIQQGQKNVENESISGHERQPALGEMTLEDFLVKAGVVTEGIDKGPNDLIGTAGSAGNVMAGAQDFGRATHWLQQCHYQQMSVINSRMQGQQNLTGAYVPGHPVVQPLSVATGPIMDAVYKESQMNLSSPTLGALSDSTPGRKRGTTGDMTEKLVERRQKRMIKNRESAARSRARKQAYTNELENKVSRLEEENERLKKQKKLDKILSSLPEPERKCQLRRTSSAPT